ncbi:HEPN domain-containing protein [Terrabacter sp. Ter38]|uniref:HEPN domain-containing protein n=1 Tax=Terrabacter sp. Ter38 TaxID=2926030 RepID=UPI00211787E0|nr:MAE_28990/MAE_18760 family HEPN-like nuclease [Terrabacter sp. Ter38]
MISVATHIDELNDRMDAAVLLLDQTHPDPKSSQLPGPVAREARGLVVVMLFAAYENLLKSLTRTLLEAAIRCNVSTKRLQPGIMTFALLNATKGTLAKGTKKLFSDSLPELIDTFRSGQSDCRINSAAFPDDGSFMKSSQVALWCEVFDISNPPSILRHTWQALDGVVSQRNDVAHGARTPGEVGRLYTEQEMRALVDQWRGDWTIFLQHIESAASTRDFFRVP